MLTANSANIDVLCRRARSLRLRIILRCTMLLLRLTAYESLQDSASRPLQTQWKHAIWESCLLKQLLNPQHHPANCRPALLLQKELAVSITSQILWQIAKPVLLKLWWKVLCSSYQLMRLQCWIMCMACKMGNQRLAHRSVLLLLHFSRLLQQDAGLAGLSSCCNALEVNLNMFTLAGGTSHGHGASPHTQAGAKSNVHSTSTSDYRCSNTHSLVD